MDKEKQSRLIIIGIFVFISLVIIGIIAIFYSVNKPKAVDTSMTSQTIDPVSGEVIDNPDGKSPESFGVNPDAPIFLGFSNLYDSGMSSNQVSDIKTTLATYADKQTDMEKITRISLDPKSIKHTINQDSGENSYSFRIVMNNTTDYIMKVTSDLLDTVTLVIYQGNKELYRTTTGQ